MKSIYLADSENIREVANIVAINEGRLLIFEKKGFWILPGGKLLPGESVGECIERELAEELPGSMLVGGLVYFHRFFGPSLSGKPTNVTCCIGSVHGNMKPAAEITDFKLATKDELLGECWPFLSDITKKIVFWIIFENKLQIEGVLK